MNLCSAWSGPVTTPWVAMVMEGENSLSSRQCSCLRVGADGGSHCHHGHVHAERQGRGLGNKQRHCEGGGGGTSWGSAWSDSGLRSSICLFDTKSSVRKENKQPGVLLPWRQRKSSYSSTTQYLQCRSDAQQHTRRHVNLHAFGGRGEIAQMCVQIHTSGRESRCWGETCSGSVLIHNQPNAQMNQLRESCSLFLLRTSEMREHLQELGCLFG